MSRPQFADIAFPTAVRQLFTYEVPTGLQVEPGMRVWVPLRNEKAIGVVIRVHSQKPDFDVKSMMQVLDQEPILSEELLKLLDWIHQFYYCSIGEVIQAALPSGLNFISEKRIRLKEGKRPEELAYLTKDKETAHEILLEVQRKSTRRAMKLSDAKKTWRGLKGEKILEELLKKEILEIWEEPRLKLGKARKKKDSEPIKANMRTAGDSFVDYDITISSTVNDSQDEWTLSPLNTLQPAQEKAYQQIEMTLREAEYHSFLLHGVTGSGKTEVYLHAMKTAIECGKGAIVLVPEIALTPQTVERFTRIFGEEVAVLHSRQTDRERADAWMDLQRGVRTIAIGPRSAVFAPVQNLGLIIVDEEHDSSYKQFDPSPRYHARDVALVRAQQLNATVVMGSATPSLTTREAVQKKRHTLLQLKERPYSSMPQVTVLDLKQYRSAMRGPLAIPLYQAVEQALDKNEQVILLYNRRGFASYLQCESCGHIPQSPDCSVSLTYHKSRNILLCHYSGYSRKADQRCELCGSKTLVAKGMGTQQVEEEISSLFPQARVVRMDRDTTSGRHDHQQIYEQVLRHEADILVGTQMLAKGLDFPKVSVVGVLEAEQELAFPSWRSSERLFQLLSQVSGRAGRAKEQGKVFIQTWKSDHSSIQCAANHDFEAFEQAELRQRRAGSYPPYSRMIQFHFKGADAEKTIQMALHVTNILRQITSDEAVLGPSPAVIERFQRKTHWTSSLKIAPRVNAKGISTLLDQLFFEIQFTQPKGLSSIRITVDVDAVE